MNPSNLEERMDMVKLIIADRELTDGQKVVAIAQLGFVNSKTGKCNPSFETIATACNVAKITVARATPAIQKRGIYSIVKDEACGDRDSNDYNFAFDLVRKTTQNAGQDDDQTEIHGNNLKPCSDVHGAKMSPDMPVHGDNLVPELKEDKNLTQETLFGEGELPPQSPPFDFGTWFEEEWWPHYPRRVDKIAAKKLARATLEGGRSDGAKASPDELKAGVMRYAMAMTGTDPKWVQHPTTWLNKGGWTNDYLDHADHRRSASSEAVRAACEEMAARSRRAAG